MPTLELPKPTDDVRKLTAERAGRDRRLHRLTDLHASAEAAAALSSAASRARDRRDIASIVLQSASEVWVGGLEDRDLFTDDPDVFRRYRDAVVSPDFLAVVPSWVRELRESASSRPETGACTVASALELWSWTTNHFRAPQIEAGLPAETLDELAEALCPLIAARCLALEVAASPADNPNAGMRNDLAHVQAARSAASAGAACAELVFGYRRHLVWDAEGCAACFAADDLEDLEAVMPGITSGARTTPDIVEADGSHPAKAGPCASFDGLGHFMKLRNKLDGCLTGARFAKDRAASAIARAMDAMIPAGGKA